MKNLKDEIEDTAYKEIFELKDVDEMFDLLIAGAYFRGRFDGMLPVDESRLVFKKIKSLLAEQEKERAVMGFIDYMYGQNLPLHKAGVVTVRAFAKQYLAERKG